jgi:hypothetical protein
MSTVDFAEMEHVILSFMDLASKGSVANESRNDSD